jgi:hypothetical protein
MQDVLREDRQERRRAAEEHGDEVEADRAENHRVGADEGQPGDERRPARPLAAPLRRPRHDQRREQRRRRERGSDGREDDGRSEEIEHAAERRAGDRRGLVDGGVPGDGVAEILARHEQRQERLLGRQAEGARRAGERDEAVDRQGRVGARRREEHEPGGRERRRGMGDEHDQAAVESVRDVAGDEHERERRDEGGKPDEAEREGRAGEVVDEPADGDVLHLQRHDREQPRGAEEPEIARAERGVAGAVTHAVAGGSASQNRLVTWQAAVHHSGGQVPEINP